VETLLARTDVRGLVKAVVGPKLLAVIVLAATGSLVLVGAILAFSPRSASAINLQTGDMPGWSAPAPDSVAPAGFGGLMDSTFRYFRNGPPGVSGTQVYSEVRVYDSEANAHRFYMSLEDEYRGEGAYEQPANPAFGSESFFTDFPNTLAFRKGTVVVSMQFENWSGGTFSKPGLVSLARIVDGRI